MLDKIRPPSPSTAISWLALGIALGGTAFAATAMLVKITDGTGANIADVDATGALRTTAVPTAPRTTFSGSVFLFTGTATPVTAPTRATVALTSVTLDNNYNQFNAAPASVSLYQYNSGAADCSGGGGQHLIGKYDVGAGQSFENTFPGGLLLKPPPAPGNWCLVAFASVKGDPSSYYLPSVSFSGFVVNGSFTPPPSAPQGRPGAVPHS